MSKLLHAGAYRYLKSVAFWFSVAATVIASTYIGYRCRRMYFNDIYYVIELVILAVLISLIVGREFAEGVFRNKVVSGHTKGSIFMSELILGTGACILLVMIYTAIMAAFNGYIFSVVPSKILIKVFVNCLLANIAFVAICVTVSCLIPHRAIVAIVCVLLAFGLYIIVTGKPADLTEPEYIETADEYDAWGNPVSKENFNEETGLYIVKNECYIDGTQRVIYTILCNIVPVANIQASEMLVDWHFGYEYFNIYPDGDLTYETSSKSEFSMTEEEENLLNMQLITIPAVIVVISAIGFAFFRKKDFK